MVTLQTNLQIKHIEFARLVTKPIFNHFPYFLLDFLCGRQTWKQKMLLPPPVTISRRSPRGTAIPIDQQVLLYSLLSDIQQPFMQLSILLCSFSLRCKRSDQTFGQVVVYQIFSILAIHKQFFLEVVEVV